MKCVGRFALVALIAPEIALVAGNLAPKSCDVAGSCSPLVYKDSSLMQLHHARVSNTVDEESAATCCGECSGKAFCSPYSGNCYNSKAKDYYESCGIEAGSPSPTQAVVSCCHGCEQGRPGFCSPISGRCYESKAKDYYESCPGGGSATPERRLQSATTSEGSIKFMSYNLFGWNAFNSNKWKSDYILKKIRAWGPDVLGAQEVETGGGQGSDKVSEQVTSESLSGGAAISQYFSSKVVEAHETKNFALVRGYWMSMTRFMHIESNVSFLFFNSHWKHGYGTEQKHIIANAVHEQRMKYGSPPTILVGDTNQFCQAHELEAIMYLTSDSSPVPFVDAIAQDKGMSYDGGCRVDFILASAGQWKLVKSFIDREGMGVSGTASDHAALMAELVPIAGEVSLES